MSEKIAILRENQHCDLCHQRIYAGEKARIIKDDFGSLVWFEHLRCPHGTAVRTDIPVYPAPQKMMFV